MSELLDSQPSEATRKGIRRTVIGMLALVAFVVASFLYKIDQPRVLSTSELKLNGAYVFDTPRVLKPFDLVDHHGEAFTAASFAGSWSLVFFGFTHCPDRLLRRSWKWSTHQEQSATQQLRAHRIPMDAVLELALAATPAVPSNCCLSGASIARAGRA